MTPCSARYRVAIDAGMPVLANLPDTSSPGVITVALIGSRMLKPGASSPNPCHFSLALSIQSSRLPIPSAASFSGPHTLNHQSLPHSSSTLRIARRKSSASMIDSSTSAVPPGASIIAAATSHEAMIAYCGEVEVCIRYASLKMWRAIFRGPHSSPIISVLFQQTKPIHTPTPPPDPVLQTRQQHTPTPP